MWSVKRTGVGTCTATKSRSDQKIDAAAALIDGNWPHDGRRRASERTGEFPEQPNLWVMHGW